MILFDYFLLRELHKEVKKITFDGESISKGIMNRFCAFIIILLSISCKEEPKCDVTGKWYFHDVTRNYAPTNTLDNGFIEFINDKDVKSNLFDESRIYGYTKDNNEIILNVEDPIKFKLLYCSSDSLRMSGSMGPYDMQFVMTKNPNLTPPEPIAPNQPQTIQNEDSDLY